MDLPVLLKQWDDGVEHLRALSPWKMPLVRGFARCEMRRWTAALRDRAGKLSPSD